MSEEGGSQHRLESAASRVERCVALLDTMQREAGVMPDARCVNVVMDACNRAGAWGEVSVLSKRVWLSRTRTAEGSDCFRAGSHVVRTSALARLSPFK